jgi:tetratricopeptide (TPR) repeat protein
MPLASCLAAALTAAAIASHPGPVDDQQHQHHGAPQKLGTIEFPVSCSAPAAAEFRRGVALLHSFWYDESEKAFAKAAAADSSCAMAHWGVAMAQYHPIWAPPTPGELEKGRAAIARAKSLEARTPREAAYVAAAAAFFETDADHRTRSVAYEQAMERIHRDNSGDDEAAIFYALALLGTAPPSDRTYANQHKAGTILNQVLPRRKDHPGVAHYLIHSFDYPALAHHALEAARSYSKIAESSPHALHMPSHIFVRLGMWDDSIRANLDSAEAARVHRRKAAPGGSSFDELHALDYLAYAYLQEGRDADASAILDGVRAAGTLDLENFAAAYALAAVPARHALERRRWTEAAALEVAPATFPWAKFPYAEAITHFARAVGSARSGDVARARQASARLDELHKSIVDAKTPYWADPVEVQRRTAAAWLAFAEGRKEEALAAMRSAADLDDATDKHPVTPGAVLPARELLGDMLAEMGRPAEAVTQYAASLKLAPHRLYALLAAASAAQVAGDGPLAEKYYAEARKVTGGRPSTRPEFVKLEASMPAKR